MCVCECVCVCVYSLSDKDDANVGVGCIATENFLNLLGSCFWKVNEKKKVNQQTTKIVMHLLSLAYCLLCTWVNNKEIWGPVDVNVSETRKKQTNNGVFVSDHSDEALCLLQLRGNSRWCHFLLCYYCLCTANLFVFCVLCVFNIIWFFLLFVFFTYRGKKRVVWVFTSFFFFSCNHRQYRENGFYWKKANKNQIWKE